MKYPNLDERFRDLFESTSDLIHFLSLDGIVEFVNPAWLKALNYRIEEVNGKPIYDFINPSCHEKYKQHRDATLVGIDQGTIEIEFLSKNGQLVIAEGQIGCYYKNDKPVSTRGVFKDTTGKKLTERRLEISEKRFRTFFKSAPEAVIVINERDDILEWNPQAEKIFGYTIDETVGKTLSDLIIPAPYREAHKKGMKHFLKTGEGPVLNKTIEITALHKNGNEFFIDLSISNAKINDEWIFIAFISDITIIEILQKSIKKRRRFIKQNEG